MGVPLTGFVPGFRRKESCLRLMIQEGNPPLKIEVLVQGS